MNAAATVDRPAAPAAPAPAAGGDIPPLHWQGGAIDCAACRHAGLRAEGGCEPGRSCVEDAYARRIDRFFRAHRGLANDHLDHGYFEVRAIAARYADLFRLGALLEDPDETVRLQLALRLPQRLLLGLRRDPHREVRIRVAQRLEAGPLASMVDDPDYQVRATVAMRLPEALLPTLIGDRELLVRREVARRVAMPALWRLAQDTEPEVRRIVAERLPAGLLGSYVDDPDLLVRWAAAGRALAVDAERYARDADSEVAARARARLAELATPDAGAP